MIAATVASAPRPLPGIDEEPLLAVRGLTKRLGTRAACRDVSFELWPGEVIAIVGESGAGKTTVLKCLSGQLPPDAGEAVYVQRSGRAADIFTLSDVERRRLLRTEWGLIHQNPRDG